MKKNMLLLISNKWCNFSRLLTLLLRLVLILGFFLPFLNPPLAASADFTYEYKGPRFINIYSGTDLTTLDYITIRITSPYRLSAATDYTNDPAVTLTMTVPGHLTLTKANSPSIQLQIRKVDAHGAPTEWSITCQQSNGPWIQSLHDSSFLDFAYTDYVNKDGALAGVSGSSGSVFSEVSVTTPPNTIQVPVMEGWWLLPGMLAGVGIFARRRKE